jgi:hypothetical protein
MRARATRLEWVGWVCWAKKGERREISNFEVVVFFFFFFFERRRTFGDEQVAQLHEERLRLGQATSAQRRLLWETTRRVCERERRESCPPSTRQKQNTAGRALSKDLGCPNLLLREDYMLCVLYRGRGETHRVLRELRDARDLRLRLRVVFHFVARDVVCVSAGVSRSFFF